MCDSAVLVSVLEVKVLVLNRDICNPSLEAVATKDYITVSRRNGPCTSVIKLQTSVEASIPVQR